MQSYTQTFKVDPQDLDELEHVNNIRYVEWIQEISKEHWLKATNEAIRKDLVWVVKNHNITYHKSAVLGDIVQLSTHIVETKG
ncbi:MAG: acyl-CoA thioesterase, partial [Allomuricauda sp.]